MTARMAGLTAWSIVALTLGLHGASGAFVYLGRNVHTPGDKDVSSLGAIGFFLAFLAFPVVTGALGAAYAGLVLLGQTVFSSVAGGGGLVVAVSTLIVAALFLPVRSHVQTFVDRRFNRRRYDAQRTLEAFGARLREQVDLGTLSGDLRTAVDETMQPAHVSVWLRERQA